MTALIASNSFPFCSPPQEASSVYIFSTSCAILRCSKFMAPETLFIDDEGAHNRVWQAGITPGCIASRTSRTAH